MMLKDRVTVRVATVEYDGWGQPIRTYEDVDAPAHVEPVSTADPDQPLHMALTGRYRVILPASFEEMDNSSQITWRGRQMQIEGEVQAQSIGGRPHHLELIAVYTGA